MVARVIYLFGSAVHSPQVNIYGIIEDNYSHDTAYNFQNTSSMFIGGGGGIATDNVGMGLLYYPYLANTKNHKQ